MMLRYSVEIGSRVADLIFFFFASFSGQFESDGGVERKRGGGERKSEERKKGRESK